MKAELIAGLRERMQGAIEALTRELQGLRTGRASISLLETVKVNAYGSLTPLNQVASVTVPESRMLSVQVWDASLAAAVEKAIREAELGLNPSSEGNVVRVRIPELSEERRKELVKVAGRYAEQGRVAIRNVRRDGMESLKKQQKNGEISEDEQHQISSNVQELTDEFVKSVDKMLVDKEKDILGS